MVTLLYTDFDFYPSSVEIQAVQDLTAPIEGSSSVLISRVSGISSPHLTFAPKVAAFPQQGVTVGRLRMRTKGTVNSPSQGFGILCLQSQRDCTLAGVAYAVRLRGNTGVGNSHLDLLKLSQGFVNGITTLLTTLVPYSDLHALQLEWAVAEDASWTYMRASHGVAEDFTDLSVQLVYQDLTSPLTTSVTEGGFYSDGGAGQAFAIRFDQLRLEGPPPGP